MSTGPKVTTWGGARPGSGRKPGKDTALSTHQVARMLRKARRAARLHKKDVDDVLLEFVYAVQEKTSDRLAAIKLWKEYTAPKVSEGGEADRALGPSIFLPEHRPVLATINGQLAKPDAA